MTKKISLIPLCIFWLVVFLTACASPSPSQQVTYRTYYESLDLSTSESAVNSFTSAFQRSDFPTVFLIFAPRTQVEFKNKMDLLQYEHLLKLDPSSDPSLTPRSILADTPWFNISEIEHFEETSYYFDILMMAAREHSALLIDLTGEVKVKDEIKAPDNQYVDVVTTVDGIDGNVIFRTVQSPSKRWRVLQVIVPNGDESQIPWSTPKRTEQ
jgi:hypothetical protein